MNIILSSIKRGLRDKDVILSNIFLVLILPFVFTLIFTFEQGKEELNINIVGNKESKIIEEYVNVIKDYDKKDKNISITYELYNSADKVKDDKNSLTVIVNEKKSEINFIGSNRITRVERSVQGITEEYFNSTSLYKYIFKEGSLSSINPNILKVSDYKVKSTSKSLFSGDFDYGPYFAVVMLQMAILTGGIIAFKNIFYIRESIGNRVKASPKKILNLLLLETLGSFLVIFLEGIIMLGGITLIYGVNLNLKNILPVLILLATLTLLAVCLGIFTVAICKKRTSGENISSMIVTILVLASGQLMPQMAADFKNEPFLNLNPFTEISNEINLLLTSNTSENILGSMGICLIVSILLIGVATMILKRRVVK